MGKLPSDSMTARELLKHSSPETELEKAMYSRLEELVHTVDSLQLHNSSVIESDVANLKAKVQSINLQVKRFKMAMTSLDNLAKECSQSANALIQAIGKSAKTLDSI